MRELRDVVLRTIAGESDSHDDGGWVWVLCVRRSARVGGDRRERAGGDGGAEGAVAHGGLPAEPREREHGSVDGPRRGGRGRDDPRLSGREPRVRRHQVGDGLGREGQRALDGGLPAGLVLGAAVAGDSGEVHVAHREGREDRQRVRECVHEHGVRGRGV